MKMDNSQAFKDRPEWINTKGHKVPVGMVKPHERLEDEAVRDIFGFAIDLMNTIARFRSHTYDDLGVLMELLGEKYGITKRGMREGGRGNVSFRTYDGLLKVGISVQDYDEFGPELQIAKKLIDEYIHEVSEGVPDEVKALLNHAFEVDKQGKINRAMLYTVRRLNISHPLFVKAMEAVKDSQRVASTREFLTISTRPNTRVKFKSLQINLANAEEVDADAD